MEISSSLVLSLPSSVPRPLPSSVPFSAFHSSFFTTNPSVSLSKRVGANSAVIGVARRTNQRARRGFSCNALFGLGVPELVVIAGVAALVFGPKKLPEVGRSIGKTVKSFQQAAKEFESELKKEPEFLAEGEAKAVSEEKKDDVVSSTKESA